MTWKSLSKMLSGGVGTGGAYMLGVLMQVPPTESINSAMGSVGWVIAAVLFLGGMFGVNVVAKGGRV